MKKKKKLYVYSNPNQMDGYKLLSGASIDAVGHNFTDAVAICFAENLDETVIKFILPKNSILPLAQ